MVDSKEVEIAQKFVSSVFSLSKPRITLTFAQSLNGCIATSDKKPLRLSGPQSMLMTHVLRRNHDGIMVGRGTLKADNPKLTARDVPGDHQPIPIIVGACNSQDFVNSSLSSHPSGSCIVLTNSLDMNDSRIRGLKELGIKVVVLHQDSGKAVDLKQAFERLRQEYQIHSIMIEGGADIINHVLSSSLADNIIITTSPSILDSTTCIKPNSSISLKNVNYQQFGQDMVIAGTMK